MAKSSRASGVELPKDLATAKLVRSEVVEIARLRAHPRNPRTHDDRNLESIRSSVEDFSQQKPVVVDREYQILAGHGTVEGARRAGWTRVWVVVSTLEGEAAVRYMIADNRTAELAAWDYKTLAALLEPIGAGAARLGFTDVELQAVADSAFFAASANPATSPSPSASGSSAVARDSGSKFHLTVELSAEGDRALSMAVAAWRAVHGSTSVSEAVVGIARHYTEHHRCATNTGPATSAGSPAEPNSIEPSSSSSTAGTGRSKRRSTRRSAASARRS